MFQDCPSKYVSTHVNGEDMLSLVQEVDSDWTTSDTATAVGLLVARQFGEDLTLVVLLLLLLAQRRTATADPLKHLSSPYRSFSAASSALAPQLSGVLAETSERKLH